MQCVGGYKDEEEFKLKRRYLRGGEYIYIDCYCKNCSKLYNREYQRIYKARKVAEAYLKGYNDRAQEEIEMAIDRVKIAEKREKQIKELEERIKIYTLNGDNIKLELYIKNNYIPKSLIKEKIEELKQGGNDWIIQREIKILEKLLKGEEK